MPDTVHVTFFDDFKAQQLRTADLTLEELKTRVLTTHASDKSKLPWLKLAIFGNKRTTKKSLRHDANVIQITGVELDYDGPDGEEPWIGFDQAVELVKAIGIRAMVYTSPSHTAATPKWRILAPTSTPLLPEMRAKLVARVNGHMGAPIQKVESFTLSQAYYYGRSRENTNANHLAMVVDGDYVDLRSDLEACEDAGRPGGVRGGTSSSEDKKGTKTGNPFTDINPEAVHGFKAILAEIGDGSGLKGFNDVLTRAAASYVAIFNGHPFDEHKLKQLLRKAVDEAPKKPSRPASDIVRYKGDYYLDDIVDTARRKFIRERNKSIGDFIGYLPMHNYIYIPTGQHWPAASVNSCLPPVPMVDARGEPIMKSGKHNKMQKTQKASDWLDQNQAVEQMTWIPGGQSIVRDKVLPAGGGNGWSPHMGAKVYNLYQPPSITQGNANSALPWINHVHKVYPDDADHIINFMAHRVQYPGEKINHALMLGGSPGIGKDTMLEPVKKAVGTWNFQEISPGQILAPFNQFLQAVILRISEARDQGEVGQYKFYEHMKVICAAPPDVLRINAKHIMEYYIPNCCGVIITTNHRTGAVWIPENDRRNYIAWSTLTQADFTEDYWNKLWLWLGKGEGCSHVAAYLKTLDISKFDAKAPPKKTDAFYTMVDAGTPEKTDDIADALDAVGQPDAVTVEQLELVGDPTLQEWFADIKNAKSVHYRMEASGYVAMRSPHAKDGRWVVLGRRKKVYVRDSLPPQVARKAVQKLVDDWNLTGKPPKNNPVKSTVTPFPGTRDLF